MDEQNLFYRLSPNVRKAMYHKAANMRLRQRIIFDYELLYLIKGELRVRVEEKEYAVKPGAMVLFKPGKHHEFITLGDEEAHMPHVHFDAEFCQDFSGVPICFKPLEQCSREETEWIREDILGDKLNFPDIINIENHKEILNLLLDIINYYERGDFDSFLIQKSLLMNILYLIHTGLKARNDKLLFKNSKNLEQAAKFITEHYNEKIYTEQLARISCLSKYHFERLFKLKYGITPQGFQIRYRIDKSKELMRFTMMSISSIAEKVGYNDIHSFNKSFKRLVGIPPSMFRRNS